jgi:hypothetical protein
MDAVSRSTLQVLQASISRLPVLKHHSNEQFDRIYYIRQKILELENHPSYNDITFKNFRIAFEKIFNKYELSTQDGLTTLFKELIQNINAVQNKVLTESLKSIPKPPTPPPSPVNVLSVIREYTVRESGFISEHLNVIALFRVVIQDIKKGLYGDKFKESLESSDHVFFHAIPTLALLRIVCDRQTILFTGSHKKLLFYSGTRRDLIELCQMYCSLKLSKEEIIRFFVQFIYDKLDTSNESLTTFINKLISLSHKQDRQNPNGDIKSDFVRMCSFALEPAIPSSVALYEGLSKKEYYAVLEQCSLSTIKEQVIPELPSLSLERCAYLLNELINFHLFDQALLLFASLKDIFVKSTITRLCNRAVLSHIVSRDEEAFHFCFTTLPHDLHNNPTLHVHSIPFFRQFYFSIFYHNNSDLVSLYLKPDNPLFIFNYSSLTMLAIDGIIAGKHSDLLKTAYELAPEKTSFILTSMRVCCKRKVLNPFIECLDWLSIELKNNNINPFKLLQYQELIKLSTELNLPEFIIKIFEDKYFKLLTLMDQLDLKKRILSSFNLATAKGFNDVIQAFLNDPFTGTHICGLELYNQLHFLSHSTIDNPAILTKNGPKVLLYLLVNRKHSMISTLDNKMIVKALDVLIESAEGKNDILKTCFPFICSLISRRKEWTGYFSNVFLDILCSHGNIVTFNLFLTTIPEIRVDLDNILERVIEKYNFRFAISLLTNRITKLIIPQDLANKLADLTLKLILDDNFDEANALLDIIIKRKYVPAKCEQRTERVEKALDHLYVYHNTDMMNKINDVFDK